jgi:vacuolar-type H+-ATPase subunit I/STV1
MENPDPQRLIEEIEAMKRNLGTLNEMCHEMEVIVAKAERAYKDAVAKKFDKLVINELKLICDIAKSDLSDCKRKMDIANTTIDADRSLLKWLRVELGQS